MGIEQPDGRRRWGPPRTAPAVDPPAARWPVPLVSTRSPLPVAVLSVLLAVALATLLAVVPAAAQTEPYPPPDPGPAAASIDCELATEPPSAACSAQGLLAGSELMVELSVGPAGEDDDGDGDGDGQARAPLPAGVATVWVASAALPDGVEVLVSDAVAEVDGTATLTVPFSCADAGAGQVLTVTGTGTDRDGNELRDEASRPYEEVCAQAAGADPGGDASAGGGRLAFTGADVLLLVLIGLLLILAGFGITRMRARHPA